MTPLEQIILHTEKLPVFLQQEILDFVEYLEIKNFGKKVDLTDKEWSELSISGASLNIEEEPAKYSVSDLKEKF